MTTSRFTYRLTMAFLYGTIALTVSVLFFSRLPFHRERVDLGSMVHGTAHQPYAYRVLVPAVVRAAAAARDAAGPRAGGWDPISRLGARLLHDAGADDQGALSFEYGVLFLLSALCFAGFGLLLRSLARVTYPEHPPFVADIAPVLALAVLPLVFFRQSNLVYDAMTLFLFTLCVDRIARRSYRLYLLAFPLAMLNKETAILLPLVLYLREAGRIGRGRLALATLAQLAFCGAVRLVQAWGMRGRAGGPVEWHLDYNLAAFGDPGFYVKTLAAVIPLAVLAGYGWRRKPAFVRRGLLVTAIPLAGVAFLLGVFGELRDYYEAYPFVFLLALPTAVEVFQAGGRPDAPRPVVH